MDFMLADSKSVAEASSSHKMSKGDKSADGDIDLRKRKKSPGKRLFENLVLSVE